MGKKVKALMSDSGGEYMSNEFKNLCVKEGIQLELTSPHNPQQNGVAERKNHNIVGATRVMLHDQIIPLHLWDETCNTMVYLQTNSPHWILGMITPEEDFLGRNPNVSHFRIFEALFYCHVSKDSRKKLEPTTELGILVGYIKALHNYCVYIPSLKMRFVRSDVNFDEISMRFYLER